MTPDELEAELAGGRVRPAYLVAGSEPLLRDRAVAAIRAAVLGDGPADFDSDRLEGEDTTPGALWDALRALPVLAPRRLVWLREPAAGRGAARGLGEALPRAVAELDPDARTVLLVTAAALDRRLGWVRAFAEPTAALVVCDAPRQGRELLAFARAEAKRLGVKIEAAALERLVERVGPQLLRLRGEIEKAALLAGPGATVTLAHVSEGVADLAEEPVWDLTDAIGEGRVGDALGVLAKLLGGGAPPPVVLATLAGHFRRLLRLRTGGAVAGPPFVRRKLEAQARRYAPARLLTALRAIHEADEALKGQGAIAPDLALERLVIGLAS